MGPAVSNDEVVRVGDLGGLGSVYSEGGVLITNSGERILKVGDGWDIDITSPWRKIFPKIIFAGFEGRASSKLYVTTERVVLIREINTWREIKEEMSPLGIPAAAAKGVHLKQLKAAGSRQFCEIWPRKLRVMRMKRIDRRWSWLSLRVVGNDTTRYAITIYKTEGLDPETLSVIQSQFKS